MIAMAPGCRHISSTIPVCKKGQEVGLVAPARAKEVQVRSLPQMLRDTISGARVPGFQRFQPGWDGMFYRLP